MNEQIDLSFHARLDSRCELGGSLTLSIDGTDAHLILSRGRDSIAATFPLSDLETLMASIWRLKP